MYLKLKHETHFGIKEDHKKDEYIYILTLALTRLKIIDIPV